jgi:hypothetical protein
MPNKRINLMRPKRVVDSISIGAHRLRARRSADRALSPKATSPRRGPVESLGVVT